MKGSRVGLGGCGWSAPLTCLLSPWWTRQRSCTPFSTRFFCRASTAWPFHSQAWAKAAPA